MQITLLCVIDEALLYTRNEQKMLDNKLSSSSWFARGAKQSTCYFRWITKGKRNNVITKIIELSIALCANEELYDLEGKQATFTDIVSLFSSLFGVEIKNPHKIKSQVLERYSSSPFIRELSDAFEDESKISLKRRR